MVPQVRVSFVLLLAVLSAADAVSPKKAAKFRLWLDERGALGSGHLRIGKTPRGLRGVMTTRGYNAEDAMFALPLSAAIKLGPVDWPRPTGGLPTTRAGYEAMLNVLRSSRWKPYARLLPKLSDCMLPDCWSDAELAELREPELVAVVREKQGQLRALYDRLRRDFDKKLRFDKFMRAHFLLQTRIFGVSLSKGSGGKEIGFQVPMVDFLNTDDAPNARLVLGDDDATTGMPSTVFVVAERAIAQGAEVTIDYGGSLKPIKRLLNFGMLPAVGLEWRGVEVGGNPWDYKPLWCIDAVAMHELTSEHVDALRQRLRQYDAPTPVGGEQQQLWELEVAADASLSAAVQRRRALANAYRMRCRQGIAWALHGLAPRRTSWPDPGAGLTGVSAIY